MNSKMERFLIEQEFEICIIYIYTLYIHSWRHHKLYLNAVGSLDIWDKNKQNAPQTSHEELKPNAAPLKKINNFFEVNRRNSRFTNPIKLESFLCTTFCLQTSPERQSPSSKLLDNYMVTDSSKILPLSPRKKIQYGFLNF